MKGKSLLEIVKAKSGGVRIDRKVQLASSWQTKNGNVIIHSLPKSSGHSGQVFAFFFSLSRKILKEKNKLRFSTKYEFINGHEVDYD